MLMYKKYIIKYVNMENEQKCQNVLHMLLGYGHKIQASLLLYNLTHKDDHLSAIDKSTMPQ